MQSIKRALANHKCELSYIGTKEINNAALLEIHHTLQAPPIWKCDPLKLHETLHVKNVILFPMTINKLWYTILLYRKCTNRKKYKYATFS